MQSENPSQWTILEPLCYSSFFFATLVYGVIGYKFCWLIPQSRSTSWTRISWDTNWARIKWRRCRGSNPESDGAIATAAARDESWNSIYTACSQQGSQVLQHSLKRSSHFVKISCEAMSSFTVAPSGQIINKDEEINQFFLQILSHFVWKNLIT